MRQSKRIGPRGVVVESGARARGGHIAREATQWIETYLRVGIH